MKNETKLQRLIRKIVKEELAKIHQEPPPFELEEKPPWLLFDEHTNESSYKPLESPQHHEELRNIDRWSESPRAEHLHPQPFISKKHKKRRR